jgi:Mg2+/Co2+ transporter CorB
MILASSIIIFCLLLFSACLSGIETAIVASVPGKMQKLKAQGSKKANIVLKLLKTKDKVISTILVMNTISNTICTTISANLFISLYDSSEGALISSVLMSLFIIIFGEVIPKAIAVANAEQIALHVSPYVNFAMYALYPVNFILNIFVQIFCVIFRIKLNTSLSATDELRGVIEHHHQEGNVFKNDKDMLGGVLDLSTITIDEIMVHRSNMKIIDASLTIKDIVKEALATTHTRIPLWKDKKDNIIGILHIRNLLKSLYENDFEYNTLKLSDFISDPWFVPKNALVSQQLHEFKNRASHFAIAVDEYGDLEGIVTLEDILEVVVGPIYDEHDFVNNGINKLSNSEFIIDGKISLRDLNREMGWNLPDDHASTLAGLVIHLSQKLPEEGEAIELANVKFTVKSRIRNQLISILVQTI